MINSTLHSRFNLAAELFTQRKFQEALETYQNLFSPDDNQDFIAPSETFALEIRMRIAFCNLELGNIDEARFEFETQSFQALLSHAGPAQLEAYFFSYGNLLAKTGDYPKADEFLSRAQEIANTQLNDADTVDRVCRFRLHWAHHFADWSKLLDLAKSFRTLAQAHSLIGLMHWSSEAVCFALRGLHQYAEAKHGAESICSRLEQAKARPEHIAVWTKFIADLSV